MINFKCVNLKIDWVSLNFNYLTDVRKILLFFSTRGFNVRIIMNRELIDESYKVKNKYKMLICQSDKYREGSTQLVFSGVNADYFYSLLKSQHLDLKLLKIKDLYLTRLDICYSRINQLDDSDCIFDNFLLECRKKILENTKTKNVILQNNFSLGKILKVNKRTNSQYYRIYQTQNTTRFELELKSRQLKNIGKLLFNNEFQQFEMVIVSRYFKYSTKILNCDSTYTNWLIDFYRKYRKKKDKNMRLLTSLSYFKSPKINNSTEKTLFHLIAVLSFIESLKSRKDYKKHKINLIIYYTFNFKLSEFTKFTGLKCKNQVSRNNMLKYFKDLQQIEPIISEFSDGGFSLCVCFPFISLKNDSKNSWEIEMLVPESLFKLTYPYQFPNCFLYANNKNERKLKVWLMKSFAVEGKFKTLNFTEFLERITLRNDQLIKIKNKFIFLLGTLVMNEIISNKITIQYKNKNKKAFITDLCQKEITKNIKLINLVEILPD